MYTINKVNGIGQVIAETETSYTVYFSETDKTSNLLKAYTKVYATELEAEIALNPEMSEEEMNELVARMQQKEQESREARAAMQRIEEINIEASKKLMRNI